MRNRNTAARARAGRRSAVSIAVLASVFGAAPVHAQGRATLPAVTVQSTQDEGVKATDATTGVLGDMKLVDTPFSVNVINRKLIDDQQSQSYGDYLKNDPAVRVGNVPVGFLTIRGFQVLPDGFLYDGLPGTYLLSDGRYQLEGFDRIEVLKGASTFLYGSSSTTSIGGVLNFVPKRALDTPVRNATVGFVSRSLFKAEVDLGDRFGGDKQFGYRLNVGYKNGDQAVRDAEWNHKGITLAVDWRASRNLVVNAGLEYSENHYPRLQPFFLLAGGTNVPDAPRTSRNISQPWDDFRTIQKLAYLRADWQIAQDWNLTAQGARTHSDRPRLPQARFGFISNFPAQGDTVLFSSVDQAQAAAWSGQLTLRGKVATGPVQHQLALSAQATRLRSDFISTPTSLGLPTNIYDPISYPEPASPPNTGIPPGTKATAHSYAVSDVMKFGEQWSLIGGLRRTTIENETFSVAAEWSGKSKTRTTPLAALVFKPTVNSSLYATYAEGFEQGGTDPVSNTQLAPRETTQYEIGGKYDMGGGLLLSAALFDMKRPGEFNSPVFPFPLVRTGSQRHRGVEVTATGAATRDLSIVAGFTYLRPKLTNTGNPAFDGQDPAGVPRLAANVYGDYRLGFVPGLFVNGGLYAVGKQYYDNANTQRVPGYVRADLGARYETKVMARPTVVRFNVENVLGKDYWASALGGVLTLADPRTYKLSATVGF